MTQEFYATYLEKKYRKRAVTINTTIIILVTLTTYLLIEFYHPLSFVIGILYLLAHIFFIEKWLNYHLYDKPINMILLENMNAPLFKSVREHAPGYHPLSMWALSAAIGEGDYQRIVNICNYYLSNTKDKKVKESALMCLLRVYYELQDIDKLRVTKAKYEELQSNTNKPKHFISFIEAYINEDFENSKKHLNESISLNPKLRFIKARDSFHLGLLNYKCGDFEAARANFTHICEKAPKLYYATFAQSYIDAIDNCVSYNHAEEIGEILPQEDFADSLKSYYPLKKAVILHKIKNIPIIFLATTFIIYGFVSFYFISTPYCFGMPPNKVDVLFDCSIEEYFDKDLELYDETGDLRKCATIYENGHLFFYFSRYQAKRLKESEWLNAFRDSEKPDNVEISDNLKEITVYVTPEMNEYSTKDWENFESTMERIGGKINLYQSLNNIPNENATISYKEIDSVSGEVIREFDLPWGYTVDYGCYFFLPND